MAREDFKISYSRISTYLFCPHRYKLIYIDNLHAPINADITFGHSIHKTLEKFHSNNGHDLDFLMVCFDDCWKNDGFKTPVQSYEYYLRGKKMLETYFETFAQTEVEILHTEKSFDANIGKYRFIGIIDRIDKYPDGTYEVMDYKTHAKIWDQERVDKDLQLTFYAYACKNVFGLNPDKISVYFLSDNIKIYTKRSSQDISKAIDLSLEAAEKITEEDFSPNKTKCEGCNFNYKCVHSSFKSKGVKQ